MWDFNKLEDVAQGLGHCLARDLRLLKLDVEGHPARADMCVGTRVGVHMHVYMHVYRHVYRHVCWHKYRHVYKHVYRRVCGHVYKRVQACVYTIRWQ